MTSTVGEEKAGNPVYQQGHMELLFDKGFSFSGYERDHLFLNRQGQGFQDISGISGIDSLSDGRAAVPADLDNDGDLDVFLTTIQGSGHLLFRNNVGHRAGHIRLALEGRESGKDAFGAQVRVKTSQGILTGVKSGGNGFLAQPDPRLLFGLGRDGAAEWVEITWPSGRIQKMNGLKAGTSLLVVEGQAPGPPLIEKKIRLPEPLDRNQRLWSKLNLKAGEPIPTLRLSSVSPDTLPEIGDGAYFVNLWATWCAPCRKEMPELEKLKSDFEARGIRLVGVSLDRNVQPEALREFARQVGVSYPLYLLEQETLSEIFAAEAFLPLSILTDREGRVVEVFAGWSPQTERNIRTLLGITR